MKPLKLDQPPSTKIDQFESLHTSLYYYNDYGCRIIFHNASLQIISPQLPYTTVIVHTTDSFNIKGCRRGTATKTQLTSLSKYSKQSHWCFSDLSWTTFQCTWKCAKRKNKTIERQEKVIETDVNCTLMPFYTGKNATELRMAVMSVDTITNNYLVISHHQWCDIAAKLISVL